MARQACMDVHSGRDRADHLPDLPDHLPDPSGHLRNKTGTWSTRKNVKQVAVGGVWSEVCLPLGEDLGLLRRHLREGFSFTKFD